MKICRGLALAGWLAGSGLLFGCATAQHGVLDIAGKPVDPFGETNSAATVLIFVSNDCPVANRYVPEIERLQGEFAERGVKFWLVHAEASESAASIRQHAKDYNLTVRELRDPDHKLVELSRVEVTPSAALFSAGGRLVYRGRIDNRFADVERERNEPTQRDLEDALKAVLAGQPVSVPLTQAVGCIISGSR